MASGSRPYRAASSSKLAARTAPTAIVFTRMPFGVHAAAIAPVRLFTAALAAPYGAACGMATRLAPEEMLTIEPLPFSSITAAAARDRNHTLPRFTARTWCHSSSVHFRIDLVSAPPALFTRMSTVPSSATVWSISCWHSSALVTSVGTVKARRPSARTSLAVVSSGSRRRAARTTSAPCSARTSAVPRPIPVPPPVMTATRPSSENRSLM